MKGPPLTIVVDTREQRPLEFPHDVPVVFETLGEGDYAARGFEAFARVERKSFRDLWGTVHRDHERFNAELARFGDIPRVALLVDDAWSLEEACETFAVPRADAGRLRLIVRALQWKARLPVVFAGTRERAARYVLDVLTTVVEDYHPDRLARCEEIARSAGPYSSPAELRKAALASLFGICVVCARRPGPRPKPPAPGVCACGRKERAA